MHPIRARDGSLKSDIFIPKGTSLAIGTRSASRYKPVWGEDANEWKPDRWFGKLPGDDAETRIPGVSPNL